MDSRMPGGEGGTVNAGNDVGSSGVVALMLSVDVGSLTAFDPKDPTRFDPIRMYQPTMEAMKEIFWIVSDGKRSNRRRAEESSSVTRRGSRCARNLFYTGQRRREFVFRRNDKGA